MTDRTADGTAYDVSGSDGAPVIALIHGLGLNRQIWQWHLPALATWYRVVNYDLFGHGKSGPPPARASLTVYAEQLRDLLDHLGIKAAALIGFSLGGMINRRFALDYRGRASALAILNSPHERDPAVQRLVEERAAQVAGGGSAATIDSALERWYTPEFRAGRPDIMDLIRRWRADNDPVSYPDACLVLAAGVTELIRPEKPIIVPTLVMTCENDTGSTPDMSHAIASEIPGAETIIVPGLQHMGLTEKPDLFTGPILDFLDRATEL